MSKCPKCGKEISAPLLKCPACGHVLRSYRGKKLVVPTVVGSCLLAAAFAGGLLFNFKSTAAEPSPSPTPQIVETMPPATPTPTPRVESLRIYAFGRELDSDGFTAYVGDKPFTLTVEIEPAVRRPLVSWSIRDSRGSGDSASLTVSDDGTSCEFTAIKPTGRNELTVNCFGAEVMIPVFLWER